MLKTPEYPSEPLQFRSRVGLIVAEIKTFRLLDLTHRLAQRAQLGFGELAPLRVLEMEVQRHPERPTTAREEHVRRQVDHKLVAVEAEHRVDRDQ